MKVIQATMGDLQDVMEMHDVFGSKKYHCLHQSSVRKNIRNGQCFIAVDHGQKVGSIILETDEWSCEIGPLVSQQKGVGTVLVQFAIDRCKKQGVTKLWCWSLKRLHAIGFYRKMGFEEAFLLRKQWYGEDCFIFGKVLKKDRTRRKK